MKSKKVGIVGLGNIGTPIADHLLMGGFALTVFDLRPEACSVLKGKGANVAKSCRELAETNDYIISLVRDIPQTKQVIYGRDGLWDGLTEGKILIIMSTINPEYIRELAHDAAEKKVTVVDAAVSGSEIAAKDGTLAVMVGSDENTYQDVLPLFNSIGKSIFHMGPVGSGMVMKLVNAAMRTVNLYGVREGLKLAVKAGVEPKRLFEVVNVSTGQSWGSVHWERDQREVERYRQDPLSSRFSLMAKDREIALELAKEIQVNVPLLNMTKQVDLE